MTIKSKPDIISDFAQNAQNKSRFHDFIQCVFPKISFQKWDELGFWTDTYRPYALLHGDQIVANVSVSLMTVILNDRPYAAAQLGAVGTIPEYRQQGYMKYLINYVLKDANVLVDFYFLFANETVLDFYPRFGFTHIKENVFIDTRGLFGKKYAARKLSINKPADYKVLLNVLNNRKLLTGRFGALDFVPISMWHVLNTFSDNIFYLPDSDVIIIKEEIDNVLHIWEVFHRKQFSLDSVIPMIIQSDYIDAIHYHFPPDQLTYSFDTIDAYDSLLFTRGDFKPGNRPFCFPATACT